MSSQRERDEFSERERDELERERKRERGTERIERRIKLESNSPEIPALDESFPE